MKNKMKLLTKMIMIKYERKKIILHKKIKHIIFDNL